MNVNKLTEFISLLNIYEFLVVSIANNNLVHNMSET